jgi:hypothetical protein
VAWREPVVEDDGTMTLQLLQFHVRQLKAPGRNARFPSGSMRARRRWKPDPAPERNKNFIELQSD